MNQQTKHVLFKILKEAAQQQLKQVVSNLLGDSDKVPNFDTALLFHLPAKNPGNEEETGGKVRDARVEWLVLSNFRSIPAVKDERYGIRFCNKEGQPQSLFLVGRNSTGKTTIFSALEHHYVSVSSLSKEMQVDAGEILTYGFNRIEQKDFKKPSITVKMSGSDSITESLDAHVPICNPASFCSEYDLIQLSSKGNNLYYYLLSQLGFDELGAIRNRLEELHQEIENLLSSTPETSAAELKSNDIGEVIRTFARLYEEHINNKASKKSPGLPESPNVTIRTSYYEDDQKKFENGETPKLFGTYWRLLEGNRKNAEIKISPIKKLAEEKRAAVMKTKESGDNEAAAAQKLKKLYQRLEQTLKDYASHPNSDTLADLMEQLAKERIKLSEDEGLILPGEEERKIKEQQRDTLNALKEAIDKEREEVVKKFSEKHFEMVEKILSFFSDHDGKLYISMLEDDNLIINMRDPKAGKGLFEATPQEYFNTFRYRLYAVSFKIALALLDMQLKNVRVPIVIDDVFSASDFENNQRLETFVYNIYQAYNSLGFDEPLQLILLTHDEMVQTAFRKGAEYAGQNYICGRLFPHQIAKQMNQELYGQQHLQEDEYYNLYMTF